MHVVMAESDTDVDFTDSDSQQDYDAGTFPPPFALGRLTFVPGLWQSHVYVQTLTRCRSRVTLHETVCIHRFAIVYHVHHSVLNPVLLTGQESLGDFYIA